MEPSGNERPTTIAGRPPFVVGAQLPLPVGPSPPVVGSDGFGTSRTGIPSAQATPSVPLTGRPYPSFRPAANPGANYNLPATSLTNFNSPEISSLTPPFRTQDAAAYQQTQAQAQWLPSPSQPITPLQNASLVPPTVTSGAYFRPPPSISGQFAYGGSAPSSQPPTVYSSMSTSQPPLQGYSAPPPGGRTLARAPINSPFTNSSPLFQPPGQPSPQTSIAQPISYPFQQRNVPPPPMGPPSTFGSKDQLQFPNIGPPIGGTLQSLVEDFQSLSVNSVPGSMDPGVDVNALPRPFYGDEVPTKVLGTYPLNCDPRFFRLTTHAIPSSQSLLSRWHLPLGAVVHPLAEPPEGEEVPIVNLGAAGVIRCRKCRTYINPYAAFSDSGRKWRCNLCSLLNDVPMEYFCDLDASGRRIDADQRPELCKGSVEFIAPMEYMVRPPMPPSYFFLIDVSLPAVQSGLLKVVAKTIKSCLNNLLGHPRTQIGFLTFDSSLHFHNFKSSLTHPQMLVVADLDDIFLPLPDDLLVNLVESRHVVEAFLDSLPNIYADNTNVESAFGPALKAAMMVMGQIGGKLLVFQSSLPSLGIGRLRLRGNDARVYGTDKEYTLRVPEDPFYKQMAAEFTKNQIAIDVFTFSDRYSDVASLGSIAKYTGGQVYHYPSFQAATHEEKLRYELTRNLTRETAWESVMRVRCGKGVRFTAYHGHFMLRSTDLLALPAVDSDKTFAMQLSLEETLMTTQTVYFQVALLYTSSSGERRIRVHTAAAPVVTDLGEMYRQADTGAIISVLSRTAVESSLTGKLEDTRQQLQLKLVKSLKEYRNLHVTQHRLGGRLIYPESLRFLPLYILALSKSTALYGGYADVPLDERCAAGYSIMIMSTSRLLKYLYPALYRLDEILAKVSGDYVDSMNRLALTIKCLDTSGLYLLDDGFNFVIWLGRMLPAELASDILGNSLANFHDLPKNQVIEIEKSSPSRKLMSILQELQAKEPSSYQLPMVVRQGDQQREGFLLISKFVEDPTAGATGYLDWVLQIYRQTQGS